MLQVQKQVLFDNTRYAFTAWLGNNKKITKYIYVALGAKHTEDLK